MKALSLVAAVISVNTAASAEDAFAFDGLFVGVLATGNSYNDTAFNDHEYTGYGVTAGYDHALDGGYFLGADLSYLEEEFAGFIYEQTIVRARAGIVRGNAKFYTAFGLGIDAVESSAPFEFEEEFVTFGVGAAYRMAESPFALRAEVFHADFLDSRLEGQWWAAHVGLEYHFR